MSDVWQNFGPFYCTACTLRYHPIISKPKPSPAEPKVVRVGATCEKGDYDENTKKQDDEIATWHSQEAVSV